MNEIGSAPGPSFTIVEPSRTPAHPDGVSNMPQKQSELPPQPSRMSADGKRLALMWHAKDGISPTAIGDRLRRNPSSISRLLSAPPNQNPTGRPRELTKQQIDKLIKLVDRMVQEAMAEDEVTQRMILRASCMQFMKDVRISLVLLERRKFVH